MKEKNQNFILPKNIKQMGSIDDNFKIYVEDYVFTYLQQYSKDAKGDERISMLIGETYTVDGSEVLFINGAIKGEYAVQEEGILKFSEKSFEYINTQKEKFFPESNIVGWFYSQPGFLDYVNEGYINYHKEIFELEKEVFFLSDPIENIGGFYRYKDNNFENVSGFIIYYEKNEAMSEYMLANKIVDIKSDEKRYREKDEKLVDVTRNKSSMSKIVHQHKKMASIFGSLSAILFLICFIMGTGLIQSDDRISELENRLYKLDETYRYILSQMKDDNVQSVFAENSTIATTIEATTSTTIETTTTTTETTTKEQNTEITTKAITTETSQVTNLKTYEVKEGDSLELISKTVYGTRDKIEDIMRVNGIEDANKIYSGMIIKLP